MEAKSKSNAEEVYLTLSNGNKQRISRMKLIVRTTSYSIIESITKKVLTPLSFWPSNE